MRGKLRRIVPHSIMLLTAIALYWAARQIDSPGSVSGSRIGPDFWPKAIIGFMALLCAYEIAKRLLTGDKHPDAAGLTQGLDAEPSANDVATPTSAPERPDLLYGGIALVLGYVFGVEWLGFFVATTLFLMLFSWLGGARRPLLCVTVGLVGGLVLLLAFMRVAYISLPLGAGPFRELSLLLLRLIGVS